jgi:rubrerythrin
MPRTDAIVALMKVPSTKRDPAWLKESLQAAVQLEFATIPPYLAAYWSIEDPGDEVASTILEIALDEMRHMGLVCNMLTGLGETPQIATPGVVPTYPGPLPGGVQPDLIISLRGMSRETAELFTRIERPEHPLALTVTFNTIGEFYDAILEALVNLAPTLSEARQLARPNFGLTKITTLDQARAALELIKHQGEGSIDSPTSTDPSTLAHYYRFKEMATGHRLVKDEATGEFSFTGDEVKIPPSFPMAEVPAGGYQRTDVTADVAAKLDAFDEAFTTMLNQLQTAWQSGTQSALSQSISTMRDLGDLAIPLMQIPIPGGTGNYGPCFHLATSQPSQ